MRKALNNLLFIFILLIISVYCSSNVYASPTNNKTSFVVGADYGNASSIANANNAHSTYKSMGLNSFMIDSPTVTNVTGEHTKYKPFLESGIIYFSGHATSDSMKFPSVLITKQNTISGKKVGIGYYDNTKTAFVEFAGCETASGTDNIANYTYNQGARITMGWTTELNRASFVNWNKRFNSKIKNKTTSVNDAAKSASNYIYLNNNVKNYRVYGAGNYNPWYFIKGDPIASSKNLNVLYLNDSLIEKTNIVGKIKKYVKDDVLLITTNYIKSKINTNFNASNYKIEINGNDTKYIDYILYYGDIRTNIGYTFSVDERGKITFHNNMNNISESEAFNRITKYLEQNQNKTVNYSSIDRNLLLNAKKSDLNADNEIINQIRYFDFDTNSEYYVVEVKNTTVNGAIDIIEYRYEI